MVLRGTALFVAVAAVAATLLAPVDRASAPSAELPARPVATTASANDLVVRRIAGTGRVATAVAASRAGWTRAEVAVLARADDPTDALAGASIAGHHRAPLLITGRDALATATAEELQRLGVDLVLLLGGPGALAEQVARDVQGLGMDVERLAGRDRWSTATAIADALDVPPGGTVLLSASWPDALAASGVAARRATQGKPWPILLTQQHALPAATVAALDRLAPRRVLVAGGPRSISDDVVGTLRDRGHEVERRAGRSRYETSLAITRLLDANGPRPGRPLVVATGADFPDGLAAGPLAARLDAPLLLTPPDRPEPRSLAWSARARPSDLLVVGGPRAIDPLVVHGMQAVRHRSPLPAPEVPADAVRIRPQDDPQRIVDAHPAGTTFVFTAGLHRHATVRPRTGDTYLGEAGARLTGARDLSAGSVRWRRDGELWFVDGQTQRGVVDGELEEGGNRRDRRPEQLFVDDQRWTHVGGPTRLRTAGTWWFDYEADRIWIGVDPATLGRIETSVTPSAFDDDGADDVTVANLVIEKYASPTRRGAIDALRGRGWRVQHTTVRDNHGVGIAVGAGAHVEECDVHGNGQLGIRARGIARADEPTTSERAVIARNRVHDNGHLDFLEGFELGGMKLAEFTEGILVVDNWVHGNRGPGVWTDVYGRDVVLLANLLEDNSTRGALVELTDGAFVAWNVARNNGTGSTEPVRETGISISNSTGVKVLENLLHDNPSGIVARSAADRDLRVRGLEVRGNHITLVNGGRVGLNIDRGETTAAYFDGSNRFVDNTYHLSNLDRTWFLWADDRAHTAEEWRGFGQDVGGTFVETQDEGRLPPHALGPTWAAAG